MQTVMQCTVTKTRRSTGRSVGNAPDLIRMMPNIEDHDISNHISIQRSSSSVSYAVSLLRDLDLDTHIVTPQVKVNKSVFSLVRRLST